MGIRRGGGEIARLLDGAQPILMAAEQLGRICVAMEIEPKYVAVTLERMAALGCAPRLAEAA